MRYLNKPLLFSIITVLVIILSTACKKETETITNTIVERDTVINIIRDTIIQVDTITSFIQDSATTFILVRHAETAGFGSNPSLSTAGRSRANNLSTLLSKVSLNAVYSTNFNRTRETAQTTATNQALSILTYDPFNLSPFVDSVLIKHHDGTVLVVGHSNTTPSLLNELMDSTLYSTIPESEYDNLYLVSVFEKGRSEVIHLKY